ncbi:CK5P3 protein, partial [Leucopsar rothschildi]|nr:CK5P3 protein [Leucopsar rothschildi]
EDVRRELLAQVQALPSLLSRVGDGASALGDAIELYEASVAFVCDSPGAAVLPLLRHVQLHGNSSVFRWRTGQEPRLLQRPELREAPEPPPEDTVGPGGTRGVPDGTRGTPGGRAGPFWGRAVAQGRGGLGLFSRRSIGGISPRSRPRAGTSTGASRWSPVPREDGARGSDALTLLENAETRNQFIDELMELELFLAQRLLEMEDEADVVAMSQLQLAPAVLQGQSSERVRALLATTRDLLAQLCSRSVQHLCMILASPR